MPKGFEICDKNMQPIHSYDHVIMSGTTFFYQFTLKIFTSSGNPIFTPQVNIFSCEIVSKIKSDIHMVTFNLFSCTATMF